MDSSCVIKAVEAEVCFRMPVERVDNLKEYFVKSVSRRLQYREFRALQNINLEVRRGESWGIVGANGSGKSTLLKMICGILKPCRGTVQVRGTVAPMIELGAGFDGELTASENIYLNGAVLGYTKKFIDSHYEDIVDFSELKNFIYTPVKNYSSGMSARLGFAIATIGRPDILIVDEVLSVGDMAFQKKCRRRMQELIEGGTTLLLVSHNGDLIEEMCEQALWLSKGQMMKKGTAREVCRAYMEDSYD